MGQNNPLGWGGWHWGLGYSGISRDYMGAEPTAASIRQWEEGLAAVHVDELYRQWKTHLGLDIPLYVAIDLGCVFSTMDFPPLQRFAARQRIEAYVAKLEAGGAQCEGRGTQCAQ